MLFITTAKLDHINYENEIERPLLRGTKQEFNQTQAYQMIMAFKNITFDIEDELNDVIAKGPTMMNAIRSFTQLYISDMSSIGVALAFLDRYETS